jgi:hypothetical protein
MRDDAATATRQAGRSFDWAGFALPVAGLVLVLMLALALIMTARVVYTAHETGVVRRHTTGEIVEVRPVVVYGGARSTVRRGLHVTAAYAVDGRSYQAEVRNNTSTEVRSPPPPPLTGDYRVGQPVDVYYLPVAPDNALVGKAGYVREAQAANGGLAVPLWLMVVAAAAALVWVLRRRSLR